MKHTLSLLSAFLLIPLARSNGETPRKPNILFLVADDLATRLGCYGDKAAITPNLDRLASEGVLFNRAYVQGAVCTPSRTSFMLGLNTNHAKANHFVNYPDTMTVGRWMREHGYQTFSVGKLDHDDKDDKYVDPKAWDIRVKYGEVKTPIQKGKLTPFDEDMGLLRKKVSFIGVQENPEALEDWARAERALEFFEKERDPQKPFFAAVGFHSPHVPWDASKSAYDAHDPARFTLEPTPANATPLPPGSMLQEPGMEMTEQHQREGQRGYYAAVTMLDSQIGRMLDRLRDKGILENTIIVFTSDHGYHLGWRGQWCKHSIDEQVLRVPLIVKHPQGMKGGTANGIVELLDLFPSFCDFAGLPIPEPLDGKSFLPLVQDPQRAGKDAAFCNWGNGRTIRTDRWRLTERNDGSRELYDHLTDQSEYYSVAQDPRNAPEVQKLTAMLNSYFGPLVVRPSQKPKATE